MPEYWNSRQCEYFSTNARQRDVIEFYKELKFTRKLMIQPKTFLADCNGKYDNIFDITVQIYEFNSNF